MKAIGIFFVCLLVIVGMLGLGWVVTGNQFFLYKVFAPLTEQVRYNTFKQSQAYNEGMVRDLQNLKMQYEGTADPAAKAILKDTVIHRFEVYPVDSMPPELRTFYENLLKGAN